MRNFIGLAVLSAAAMVAAPVQAAVVYNSTPAVGWHFGSGNGYAPSNTAVLTDGGNQIYLRAHQNGVHAPASDSSGVYSFGLGTSPLNFDWGVSANFSKFILIDYKSVNALVTITNAATGDIFSYNPFAFIPYGWDNAYKSGSVQNSFQLDWPSGLNFDPSLDNTYEINLAVWGGVFGGSKDNATSLSIFAKLGDGYNSGAGAVPEPASWAMLIAGFALVGANMRRRRTAVSFS